MEHHSSGVLHRQYLLWWISFPRAGRRIVRRHKPSYLVWDGLDRLSKRLQLPVAVGGGGSNFTGSYSATQSLTIEGGGTGQAVPEPGTASLFVLGLVLVVGGLVRRR